MFAAALGIFKGNFQDALHLVARIGIGVVGIIVAFFLFSEIHAAGELTDADEIGATDEFVLQRRFVDEAVEGLNGTYVGKEAQLLAHGKESLLGTHFGVGVVVEARITNG